MAVVRATGRFSFCSSASGMRQSTASVSGLSPGGRGVGTPGLMGSLWPAVVGGARDADDGRGGEALSVVTGMLVVAGAVLLEAGGC